jgi:hypothetical protein
MGSKKGMARFCVKSLELYIHPWKNYVKAPYLFKLIQGVKKCPTLFQVKQIPEDPTKGTDAVALRKQLIVLGFAAFIPDDDDII